MPSVTIPLVGVHNQRDDSYGALTASKDQRFINCLFGVVKNPVTGDAKFFVEKRPGWGRGGVVSAGTRCRYLKYGNNTSSAYFEMSNGNVYTQSGTLIGPLSGIVGSCNAQIDGVDFTVFCAGSAIYYAPSGLVDSSFTGDTTNGSPVVVNVDNTSTLFVGLPVTGTGIPANTRILSIDSASQVTLTQSATATNSITITVSSKIAQVNDADVVGPLSVDQMDGYLFYSTFSPTNNGRIYNSDLNSLISYSQSNYISFNENSDEIVFSKRHGNKIIGLGDKTISFYANAGNPSGSPLSRVTNSSIIGIGAYQSTRYGWSFTEVNGDIYFPSSPWNGSIGIYKISNDQITKVSTPQEDSILSIVTASGQDLVLSGFKLNGYSYISVVSFVAGVSPSSHNFTLVYNVDLNIWGEWSGNLHTFIVQREATQIPTLFAASIVATDGAYYRMPDSSLNYTYQDDGSAYTMTVQTSKQDFGSENLKTIKSVSLMGSDIQSTGTATLEYSDDDYTTWTTAGTFDLTKINPKIHRCGSFRGGRAWRLTHSANTPFRAQALKFDYEIGSH